MIDKLVDQAVALGAIESEDEEIYRYSYSVLLMLCPIVILVLVFGWMLDCFIGSAVMLLFFIPLRQFSGGMHSASKITCMSVTLIIFGAIMAIPALGALSIGAGIQLAIAIPAIVLIFVLAPQEDENKPLSENEKRHYKKVARIVLAIEVLIVLAFLLVVGNPAIMYYVLSAINLAGANVTLKAILNRRKKRRPSM